MRSVPQEADEQLGAKVISMVFGSDDAILNEDLLVR
jgi:hypothetical protein